MLKSNLTNALGQPIGYPVADWSARDVPPETRIVGQFCRVEPLDEDAHAADLFDAVCLDTAGGNWTYLPYGPFSTESEYRSWVQTKAKSEDPKFHAIVDLASGCAVGVASLMRVNRENGVIEVGHIHYSPRLQRQPAATEEMYLLMRRVFDELGYRRYEWKCDDLNAPSRGAAERLGFRYEGTFRQAVVYRGRNRDTAWYSIIDDEWPRLKTAFERWLSLDNFDADGLQRRSLGEIRDALE